MNAKMFVHDELIPNDGSKEIIERFNKKIHKTDASIYIYPDVHYKKGAKVTNGMLIKSPNFIFPSCLGVENCGYTVGKIESKMNNAELQKSFERYAHQYLSRKPNKYASEILNIFKKYLEKDYDKKKPFYSSIHICSFEQLWQKAQNLLAVKLLKTDRYGIGNLGGGNHFFELHEVTKSFEKTISVGEKWFIVHSDSIAFGNTINLLYSNLNELDYLEAKEKMVKKLYWRLKQLAFFCNNMLLFTDMFQVMKLLYSQNDYRTISSGSRLGIQLLLDHNLASVFGDINRDYIIREWAECNNIKYTTLFSHAHDNVIIEKSDNEKCVFHRNGVQYIGNDPYYMLPGAMGTESYILKNTYNKEAFFSANHGVGRIKDKHLARQCFKEKQTLEDLEMHQIKIYRIGSGDMAEQNRQAFKDVSAIIEEMEKFGLGKRAAITHPFAILKG